MATIRKVHDPATTAKLAQTAMQQQQGAKIDNAMAVKDFSGAG